MRLARAAKRVFVNPMESWWRIWFQPKSTAPLELSRIGIGLALLCHYAAATPYLFTFWGNEGWLPPQILQVEVSDPLVQSVLFYITAPWQLVVFHAVFVFCCLALTLGWRTRWVKWLVL